MEKLTDTNEGQEKENQPVDNKTLQDNDTETAAYESALQKNDKLRANDGNIIPNSLMALLDDRNKSIVTLRRQIQNQKLQLGFYLHKVLSKYKIKDFATTCVPYKAEENLQINLAMTRFCKQTGLESRIMNLHNRMMCVEQGILTLLPKQEEMVHEIVDKIIEFARKGPDTNPAEIFCRFINEDGQVDILAKIMSSTNKLRKELNHFRSSCDSLINIEEERNSLVDKVYSMPIAQRISYGVVLAANYEKIHLQNEVREIKKEQKLLQDRLSHLPTVLDAYNENYPPIATDQNNVSKLLETVNTDAISLLAIAKDQKEKYVEEIAKLRKSNSLLGEKIHSMHKIETTKGELESNLAEAKVELKKVKEQNKIDINELRTTLEGVMEEREFFQNKLQYYYDLEEQLQFMKSKAEDLDMIKQQRDYYKSQVEDLQAIRAAYAQLVEHCPLKSDNEPEKVEQLLSKIQENQKDLMNSEMKTMGEIITDQEMQIKHLLIIIKEMAERPDLKCDTDSSGTQTKKQGDLDKPTCGHSELCCFRNDPGFAFDNKSAYSQTDNESYIQSILKHIRNVYEKQTSSDNDIEMFTSHKIVPSSSTGYEEELPLCDEFSKMIYTKQASKSLIKYNEQPIRTGSSTSCTEPGAPTAKPSRPSTNHETELLSDEFSKTICTKRASKSSVKCNEQTIRPVSSTSSTGKPSKLPVLVRSSDKNTSLLNVLKCARSASARSASARPTSARPASAISSDTPSTQAHSVSEYEYNTRVELPSTSKKISFETDSSLKQKHLAFASASKECIENIVCTKTITKASETTSKASYSCSCNRLSVPIEDSKDGLQSLNSWQSAQFCTCNNCPIDTSVEVRTINQKGQSESMKAVFKSSQPVDSLIQINETFSLRVICGQTVNKNMSKTVSTLSPILSQHELTGTNLSVDQMAKTMDEYELMKDSSNEAMVVTLPSLHKHLGNFSMQCMGYTRKANADRAARSMTEIETHTVEVDLGLQDEIGKTGGDGEEIEAIECFSEDEQIFSQFASDNEQIMGDPIETKHEISITSRLKKITSEIGYTLSKPNGKEILLSAVKAMYGNLFTETYDREVGR